MKNDALSSPKKLSEKRVTLSRFGSVNDDNISSSTKNDKLNKEILNHPAMKSIAMQNEQLKRVEIFGSINKEFNELQIDFKNENSNFNSMHSNFRDKYNSSIRKSTNDESFQQDESVNMKQIHVMQINVNRPVTSPRGNSRMDVSVKRKENL